MYNVAMTSKLFYREDSMKLQKMSTVTTSRIVWHHLVIDQVRLRA